MALDYSVPDHLRDRIAHALAGVEARDEQGRQLVEFLKGSHAEKREFLLESAAARESALRLLTGATEDLFRSIEAD